MAAPLGVAILGCGDISAAYGRTLQAYRGVAVRGAYDRNPPRVNSFVSAFGGTAFGSLEELLADPSVDVVVNLTRQSSHHALTKRCLEAGKHVYSEKPLALSFADARELVELAEQSGLRLACAPVTFLGEAQTTLQERLRAGSIGSVRLIYAEANWGRIETWHPRPTEFYEVGPVFDVGSYPLTLVTAMLGPAVRVWAHGDVLLPARTTRAGEPFTIATPDWTVAVVELQCGAVMRLTATFYASRASRQQGIEFHGDEGMLAIDSWHAFDAAVTHARVGEREALPVELSRPPFPGVDYGRGVAELAEAIAAGRPHRGTGAHAAHVVEIMEAINESVRIGAAVELRSTFAPIDWKEEPCST